LIWKKTLNFLCSNANKADFHNFIDTAFKNKRGFPCSSPVGFFDEKIMLFLKNKKMGFQGSRIITLKSIFVNNKIKTTGDRLDKEDWYKIIDYLMFSNVFWDPKNKKIIYISIINNYRFLKTSIAITAQMRTPTIDDFSVLNFAPDSLDPIGALAIALGKF
jgi:hypothetical protein